MGLNKVGSGEREEGLQTRVDRWGEVCNRWRYKKKKSSVCLRVEGNN